ncbi:hypothetical protein Drorol1_Dr00025076 [Drosera rotundifolia]
MPEIRFDQTNYPNLSLTKTLPCLTLTTVPAPLSAAFPPPLFLLPLSSNFSRPSISDAAAIHLLHSPPPPQERYATIQRDCCHFKPDCYQGIAVIPLYSSLPERWTFVSEWVLNSGVDYSIGFLECKAPACTSFFFSNAFASTWFSYLAKHLKERGMCKANVGSKLVVRVEGFDCLAMDHRSCSIPALG